MSLCGFEYRRQCPGRSGAAAGVGLGWPGIPAELDHGRQLHVAELEGAGHRTQLHHSFWNTTRLESCPCGRLQTGQTSYLVYRKAFLLASLPDKQAEDQAPHPAVDPAEVVLIANYHTHILITPDKRPLSSKIQAAQIELHDEYVISVGSTKAPIPTRWVKKSTTRDHANSTTSPAATTRRNWAPATPRHPASARCSATPRLSAASSSTKHLRPRPTRARTPPPAGCLETITTPTSTTVIPS